MKVAIIGDTHFGISSNSDVFLDNQRLFFEKVLFPYLKGNKIDLIIHMGDVFHDRRKIDTKVANSVRQFFFEPLFDYCQINKSLFYIICGNHDIYYRDTSKVNNIEEFITNQRFASIYFKLIKEPGVYSLDGFDFACFPWITKENREQSLSLALNGDGVDYAFGHLELKDYSYSKVQKAFHGDDPKIFKNFKRVFSGHYHYLHEKDNITYVGTPFQLTWIDVDTMRGFHILDTETHELKYVQNPYNLFENVSMSGEIKGLHKRFFRLYAGDDSQSKIDRRLEKLSPCAINVQVISNKTISDDQKKEISEKKLDSLDDIPDFISKNIENENVRGLILDYYNKALVL